MIHKLAHESSENKEVDFEMDTQKWTLALGTTYGLTLHSGQKPRKSAKERKVAKGFILRFISG